MPEEAKQGKPLLIYDGDCGFCLRWVRRWRRLTGRRVEYASLQEVAQRFSQIPREEFLHSVQWVDPSGKIFSGAEAVYRTLAQARGWGWVLWFYRHLPGFAPLSERVYRFVADHRARGGVSCSVPAVEPTYLIARSIFIRGLAVVYFIAFVSLWTQVLGLMGENGISPVGALLELVGERFGPEKYRLVPTLLWFDAGDLTLQLLCGGGVFLSVLLFFHVAPVPVLLGLWALYLSLTAASQEFLSFQWDALLLETGFLSIFLVPLGWNPRGMKESPPPRLSLLLFRVLLFRLMFAAGVVKLSSQDPAWWSLTALLFHYETQPLAHGISWFAHQLPFWFQKFCCFMVFAIELPVPFLVLGPRRLRLLGAGALIFLQVLIILTGNYCYFNLLTILLCLLLLDDAAWSRIGSRFKILRGQTLGVRPPGSDPSGLKGRWPNWILIPAACFLLAVGSFHAIGAFRAPLPWPKPVVDTVVALAPWRLVNGYGLFAVMTTVRNEIVVEGSLDGENWRTYEFKYKPGALDRRPGWAAPHQPRLDWQMWFAALGPYQRNPWFMRFCGRLLEGSPEVLGLLAKNPFPEGPPRYIRARFYEYHFTDWETRRKTGNWWKRTSKGLYCPVLSIKEN